MGRGSSFAAVSASGGRARASSIEEVDMRRTATVASCAANLTNTIVGSGMLGLPHAFSESGYVVGSLLLATSTWFSAVGLHLLSVVAHTKSDGMSSFYSVAKNSLPGFSPLIDGIVAFKCFGGKCCNVIFHTFIYAHDLHFFVE